MEQSMVAGRTLTQEELSRLQATMLEMMVEFDSFCERFNIKYVITGGTLLGAVRHGGFIPWDDDADIAMTRPEYDKLKRHAKQLKSSTLFFQDHSLDEEYLWGYGKLRRPNTKLVRAGQEHLTGQTGVFVDIFPMDDIPGCLPFQILNYWSFTVLRKVLWARVGARDEDISFCQRTVFRALNCIPANFAFFLVEKMIAAASGGRSGLVHPWSRPLWSRGNRLGVPLHAKYGMKKEWFVERKKFEFEGVKLWGSEDADGFLRYCYGDYMELPPKSEQKPVLLYSSVEI
ncbi:MAG: LicD family protein [Kiritimatiellae bacterium]|nr:LicD family protein [Kiritimatiellia bacterium]